MQRNGLIQKKSIVGVPHPAMQQYPSLAYGTFPPKFP